MSFEPRDYLRHIVVEADYLLGRSADLTLAEFVADETLRRAFVRSLEIIGEAFVQLRVEDAAAAEQFPDLRQIVSMRNRLVHGDDQLDLDVLWAATISHVPKLLEQVETLLEAE